ncbi:MAG: DNA replication initiation control protein YabA [Streptococcaceae bacterium]|nr:DNA replication initiation control protein YabA [Streptococcaceae bacterium]MCL2681720.1 DNA replication initiation control protein YabA [Streptococcaceae bacterium]MCL2858255.1 DNA replication initiation control protein YabA [Streptococcaceae bacterium]
MIEKKEIFKKIEDLESSLSDTMAQLSLIKQSFDQTLTENASIRMENEKLRERLGLLDEDGKKEPNSTLLDLYNEGFHVCHVSYGQRRENEEPCAFCTGVLYQ